MSEKTQKEKLGFTEEEIEYLRKCAQEPEKNIEMMTKIMKFLDRIKANQPEVIGDVLAEIVKRNG
jgi:5-bromo-4-chloroindolyl phosphate hydrolysis protein